MNEATSPGSEEVEGAPAAEPRSPEEIRKDIEVTRGELGDTVEALAAKADVKAQAKERVADVKDRVPEKKEQFTRKTQDASPESATAGANQVKEKAQSNPLPFVAGGTLVAGFLLGRLTARS
jgi:hypothetical protein